MYLAKRKRGEDTLSSEAPPAKRVPRHNENALGKRDRPGRASKATGKVTAEATDKVATEATDKVAAKATGKVTALPGRPQGQGWKLLNR